MSTGRTKVTKQELDDAKSTWEGFTELMKVSVISTIVILGLMAFFLL